MDRELASRFGEEPNSGLLIPANTDFICSTIAFTIYIRFLRGIDNQVEIIIDLPASFLAKLSYKKSEFLKINFYIAQIGKKISAFIIYLKL